MAQVNASSYIHHAPAGNRYTGVLDAGRTMLKEKYPEFLLGKSNAMLPPIYVNVLPEQVGDDGRIIPHPDINDKQIRLLKGHSTRKVGEHLEELVFRKFEQVLNDSNLPCQLYGRVSISTEKNFMRSNATTLK